MVHPKRFTIMWGVSPQPPPDLHCIRTKMCAIAFTSRGLSHSESRYPAHKVEFLIHVLTTAILEATSYCWLAALSTFSFKLQYRAGKLNIDADSLSR